QKTLSHNAFGMDRDEFKPFSRDHFHFQPSRRPEEHDLAARFLPLELAGQRHAGIQMAARSAGGDDHVHPTARFMNTPETESAAGHGTRPAECRSRSCSPSANCRRNSETAAAIPSSETVPKSPPRRSPYESRSTRRRR